MSDKQDKNFFQTLAEYVQALVGAILLALLIRGFLFEPFKIPSESMVPTLMVGDHIFVSRYQYGLRVPFTKWWLVEFDDPERGDVVVFNFPDDDDVDFIKRVVGVPGDVVSMKDGVLRVNDKPMSHKTFRVKAPLADNHCVMEMAEETNDVYTPDYGTFPHYLLYKKYNKIMETNQDGETYMIQRSKQSPRDFDFEFKVPKGQFFVMGDNRDQSHDSRFWGFVPRENLKGKAQFIWLSLNSEKTKCAANIWSPEIFSNVRWDRFGKKIH